MYEAIEIFTNGEVTREEVEYLINDPRPNNAMNTECAAHILMHQYLAWGIEAKSVNNEVRVIRLCGADPDIT